MMFIDILKKRLSLVFCFSYVYAVKTITDVAIGSKNDVLNVYKMTGALAFLCGLAFMIVSMFKFKQFKDNPQQTTVGTPIMLFFIGVLLVYMPSLQDSSGETLFGSPLADNTQSFKKIESL